MDRTEENNKEDIKCNDTSQISNDNDDTYIDLSIEHIIKNKDQEIKDNNSSQQLMLKKYKSDIENMKLLDAKMIDTIRKMSSEDKMEIILTYNNIVDKLKYFFEQTIL